jgi:hypothetical protein
MEVEKIPGFKMKWLLLWAATGLSSQHQIWESYLNVFADSHVCFVDSYGNYLSAHASQDGV